MNETVTDAMQPEVELAAVHPTGMIARRIGMYLFGGLLFGLVPVLLMAPIGPPPGHPAYLVAWGLGAVGSIFIVHRIIGQMMESCHLTLTGRHLVLGHKAKTSIALSDVVDTVPILSGHKAFGKATAAINPEQFTVVLLRLRDGSRVPLSGVHRLQGFENFLIKLFGMLGSTIRTSGELSPADIAVLGARRANKRHASRPPPA